MIASGAARCGWAFDGSDEVPREGSDRREVKFQVCGVVCQMCKRVIDMEMVLSARTDTAHVSKSQKAKSLSERLA